MAKSKPASKKKPGSKSGGAPSFESAMSKYQKQFKKARETKADDFSNEKLIEALGLSKKNPMAVVKARLTNSVCGVTGQGVPFVRHTFSILKGEAKGITISKYTQIEEHENWGVEARLEAISQDYQRMGYETDESDISDFKDMSAELTEEKPTFNLRLKLKGENVNVNILKAREDDDDDEDEEDEDEEESDEEESDDEEEEDSESEDEEEEEEKPKRKSGGGKKPPKRGKNASSDDDEEEEESEDEEEEEDTEEEDEDETPQVDDMVKFKKPGKDQKGEWQVLSIKKGKATLKNPKTKKKLADIPVEKIEVQFDEEEEDD